MLLALNPLKSAFDERGNPEPPVVALSVVSVIDRLVPSVKCLHELLESSQNNNLSTLGSDNRDILFKLVFTG